MKRLKDAGFTNAQPETVTDIIARTRATDLVEVATKADIAMLRSEMASEADLAALATKIITWLVPPMLGQTGLIAASIKLLS